MKTLFGTNKYVLIALGVMGFVVLIACAQNGMARNHKGKVEITKDVIVLHPAVQLAAADEKAMNDVLKRYNKNLYKIDTVENGKVTKTEGSLKMTSMTAAVKAEGATAPVGVTHKSHQTICPAPCNEQRVPNLANQKQKLIQELQPILAKYQ